VTLEKPNKVAKTPSINKKGENVIFFLLQQTKLIMDLLNLMDYTFLKVKAR
jgi:hypothetical protein